MTVEGQGVEQGNVVVQPASFEICTKGAGTGETEVVIEGPTELVEAKTDKIDDNTYVVTCVPMERGPRKAAMDFAGSPISNSLCKVFVSYPFDPGEVWAKGVGVEPGGLVISQFSAFVVHDEKAGDAVADVKCVGLSGVKEAVAVQNNGDGTYFFYYKLSQAGQHVINIDYDVNNFVAVNIHAQPLSL